MEKNVYSPALEWNVPYISTKFLWSNVLFKVSVSLLIFYLDELPLDVDGVLKSPTLVVLLSVSPFNSVNIALQI